MYVIPIVPHSKAITHMDKTSSVNDRKIERVLLYIYPKGKTVKPVVSFAPCWERFVSIRSPYPYERSHLFSLRST